MIITITSWRGAGATTTSLALARALAEQGDCWLVEADPAGGVLAGRLGLPHGGGLAGVVLDGTGGDVPERMAALAVERSGMRLLLAAADPFTAHACLRHQWAEALHELPGRVVVDAGRHRAGSPAWPLLAAADRVVVVSSPEVAALVTTVEWVRAAGRSSPLDPALDEQRVGIAVSALPGGTSFPREVVRADLGDSLVGWLPFEPRAVDALHAGGAPSRHGRVGRFWREVDALATAVGGGAS